MDQGSGPRAFAEGPPRELAKFVGAPGQSVAFRDLRYGRRATARDVVRWIERESGEAPKWDRVASCGFCLGSVMEIRCTCQGGAYPCSIETCGNGSACPVCSAKIKVRRAVEVELAAQVWSASGGQLAMLTLTVRHHQWMPLALVMEAVGGGWRKLQNRKEYRHLRSLMLGTIKALEVTVGSHGWHPHIHLLMFIEADVSRGEVDLLVAGLHDGWSELAEKELGVAPSRSHGLNLRWLDASASAYVSKIGDEIARADTKGTRHPFTLLDDVRQGDVEAFGRYAEYGEGMYRRHLIDWTKGLRRTLGVGPEKTDEELAAEDEGGVFARLVEGRDWNRAMVTRDANGVPVVTEMLKEVERQWLQR